MVSNMRIIKGNDKSKKEFEINLGVVRVRIEVESENKQLVDELSKKIAIFVAETVKTLLEGGKKE